MSIIEWDNDGYPTEESLEKLEEVLNSSDIKKTRETFYSALEENYYTYEGFVGITEVEVRGELTKVWQYHTGGWSGNEDIIGVLQQSWLWYLLLERYDSGGHYYFKVKE